MLCIFQLCPPCSESVAATFHALRAAVSSAPCRSRLETLCVLVLLRGLSHETAGLSSRQRLRTLRFVRLSAEYMYWPLIDFLTASSLCQTRWWGGQVSKLCRHTSFYCTSLYCVFYKWRFMAALCPGSLSAPFSQQAQMMISIFEQ